MDNKTLRLRGSKEDDRVDAGQVKTDLTLTPKGRVRLGAARDAGGVVELPDMAADDLVCVRFSGDFKLWTRVDDLHRAYPAPGLSRSARGEANPDADVWEIEPRLHSADTERGVAGLVVEALDFFGVDLKGKAAAKLAKLLEDKKLKDPAVGSCLYRCALDGPFELTDAPVPTETNGPLLVFIHGTGSNAAGSFGALWDPANGKGADSLREFKSIYPAGVYAFEHRTLTESPIANALKLAESLPAGAELHLVSHSRGGLVGELMCLGQRRDKGLIDEVLLARLFAGDRTMLSRLGFGKHDSGEAYKNERNLLEALLAELDKKKFKIKRFVRVACPARGTTLASARLDRWLSVLGWLAPEFLDDGMDFLLGVIKERTDPRTLPGLEAMMPGSALVSLLNHPDLLVDADLSVIAGDVEGDSIWAKLKWALVDWFYAADHDLVVNTGSMYGGARRPKDGARFCFDQGKDVNHFRYFRNPKTVSALLAGLTRIDGSAGGFEPISVAKQEIPVSRVASARAAEAGPRPVVVVLPGTLGSELAQGGDHIWLSYLDLARGKLAKLGRDADDVRVLDMLEDYYGDLLTYLARSHRVVPFAYDWRLSILSSADRLAATVGGLLDWCELHRQPIRFLAHSMGGLVVRAMIARHPALWDRACRLAGSRLVMLGTPNAGSFEAVRWLTGFNPTMAKITLLDGPHDRDEIIDIVRRFPGLLELLPARGSRDFAQSALWQKLKTDADETWPLPEATDLAGLSEVWSTIARSPVDPTRMCYVAGWAPRTVCDYAVREEWQPWDPISKHKVLRFYADRRGDGTVPWELGLLNDVKTWYLADATHDELPCHQAAFPAYLDLLQNGRTERLPDTPPTASRAAAEAVEVFAVPDIGPDSLPSEAESRRFVFGAASPRPGGRKRCFTPIRARVCQGDLAYAQYPVCVGHYLGDSIVSSEAALDRHLENLLKQRMRLGLYPGPLGSHQIFVARDRGHKPGGALVLGLGRVGELSPGALESGFAHMALEYAITVANWADDRFGGADTVRSAKLTCLLIGTGAGGMKVVDSMRAILRGAIAANRRLSEAELDCRVLIDEIEFLELYRDVAILAARALDEILRDADLADAIECRDGTVCEREGGRSRVTCEEDAAWWRRLEIVYDRDHAELRFIALTDKARAEQSLVAGQLRLAEDFVREAQTSFGGNDEAARTLFEMLLPNRLKELAPERYDVVLVVDRMSARFPWEMLKDGWSTGGKPMAVAAGMLRQFKTAEYRPHPIYPPANTAYVVANPKLPVVGHTNLKFSDLPGAAREGEDVADLLKSRDFEVARRIGSCSRDILVGLHGAGYRVLHLAGHGIHDIEVAVVDDPEGRTCGACEQPLPGRTKRISGMVIGDGVFLSPGDVEQMRWVPELVFINCCHLGDSTEREPAHFAGLAANLAFQFVNMGVKAVVAAGWAVDDSAAREFALGFYRRMLAGETFGRAVQGARVDIYERRPDVNTWGAYQCYGDPDYRLVENGHGRDGDKSPYKAVSELVVGLRNLANSIRMGWAGLETPESRRRAIDKLLARVPADKRGDWLKKAEVGVALGDAYGECADANLEPDAVIEALDAAIQAYDNAIKAEKAEIPVRALEKRASFQAKRAWHEWRRARANTSLDEEALKTINLNCIERVDQASADLKFLLKLGDTAERQTVMAGACKRKAWIVQDGGAAFEAALTSMTEGYWKTFKARLAEACTDAYSPANWLASEAVMAWFDLVSSNADAARESAPARCREAIQRAEQHDTPNFWTGAVAPDCRLALALFDSRTNEEEARAIVDGYRAAISRGCSPKEKSSVLEHLDFLAEMARRAEDKRDVADWLDGIRRGVS